MTSGSNRRLPPPRGGDRVSADTGDDGTRLLPSDDGLGSIGAGASPKSSSATPGPVPSVPKVLSASLEAEGVAGHVESESATPSAPSSGPVSKWFAVCSPFFLREPRRAALLVGAAIVASLCCTYLLVLFADISRDYSNALVDKDPPAFYGAMRRYVALVAAASPAFALSTYAETRLALEWRRWMTEDGLRRLYRRGTFYRLSHAADAAASHALGTGAAGEEEGGGDDDDGADGEDGDGAGVSGPAGAHASSSSYSKPPSRPTPLLDNPDQRVTEDVRSLTTTSVSVVMTALRYVFNSVALVPILWSTSPRLVMALVVYALAGTVATKAVFGSPLARLHWAAQRAEADLRFSLVRAREGAEQARRTAAFSSRCRLLISLSLPLPIP